jgi:hypothetical protein
VQSGHPPALIHVCVGRRVWPQWSSVHHQACPVIVRLLVRCCPVGHVVIPPGEPPVARGGVLVQRPAAALLTWFETPEILWRCVIITGTIDITTLHALMKGEPELSCNTLCYGSPNPSLIIIIGDLVIHYMP